jgi:hypothetical protein
MLEHIERYERGRRVGKNLLAERFATDAALQHGKRQDGAVLPGDDLTVEHRARGEHSGVGLQLREAIGD